jgi:hypothetical protein
MKKQRLNKLRELEKNKEELFKEICIEAKKQFPINSEVLFKKSSRMNWAVGIVKGVSFWHGRIDISVINQDTRKHSSITNYNLHPDYKFNDN